MVNQHWTIFLINRNTTVLKNKQVKFSSLKKVFSLVIEKESNYCSLYSVSKIPQTSALLLFAIVLDLGGGFW